MFLPTKMLVFAMVIVFLTFLGLGIKFSRWVKNSLGGVKIHHVGTSETVRYVRSSSWHLQFNLCVLVYLRLCYTWPWKYEEKYRLIFLLVFCGISSCLARIWQQNRIFIPGIAMSYFIWHLFHEYVSSLTLKMTSQSSSNWTRATCRRLVAPCKSSKIIVESFLCSKRKCQMNHAATLVTVFGPHL